MIVLSLQWHATQVVVRRHGTLSVFEFEIAGAMREMDVNTLKRGHRAIECIRHMAGLPVVGVGETGHGRIAFGRLHRATGEYSESYFAVVVTCFGESAAAWLRAVTAAEFEQLGRSSSTSVVRRWSTSCG